MPEFDIAYLHITDDRAGIGVSSVDCHCAACFGLPDPDDFAAISLLAALKHHAGYAADRMRSWRCQPTNS